ncbi:pilus assembly protein PilO [Anoxybacteroides amylolyticum]|uniref:Pilus assembly, PilO family protein n=1 Tax=Anoxybacteroides amylolyticum TaxID=294699 RepID=A0A160F7A5_9BACL|nr:pilus assembly protein PilO [Anoxybacillus amylolyticus]ANB61913.1 pilus assembly, PilO family protein [Anoxybacillus amylolyticus]
MTVRIGKREAMLLLLMLVVASAVFTFLYFYTLKPLHLRVAELKTTVANEQKLVTTLQSQTAKQQTDMIDSAVELQKRVPVKPLVEQLLLDLEKAEVVSDSFIPNMSFNEDAGIGASQQSAAASSATQQPSTTQQNKASITLPAGLKKVTVQLTVQSPSYYQLERFLQTLEQLPRIVSVESLSFTGNPELTSVESTVHPLTYSLTVSAFYHPGLASLQNQVPPFDVPPSSDKQNPLTELIPPSSDDESSTQR